MFAKQLLTASMSCCIIQGFSYNVTVPSHVKLVKVRHCLQTGRGKRQKYYLPAHNTYVLYKDWAPCNYRATTDDPAVTL